MSDKVYIITCYTTRSIYGVYKTEEAAKAAFSKLNEKIFKIKTMLLEG